MPSHSGIDVLLDLHGQLITAAGTGSRLKRGVLYRPEPSRMVFVTRLRCMTRMENGYWPMTMRMPSARHERRNTRGASWHMIKHSGRADKGVPYEFRDAYQLLADFFGDVDRVLGQVRK